MIAHALTIVTNELNQHLADVYNATNPSVSLGNIAEGIAVANGGNRGLASDMLYLSVVNIKEEKTLMNVPNHVRDDAALRITYENPPIFLNFQILMTATHADYTNALVVLSRAIRFFQFRKVFTQDSVDPNSINQAGPMNVLDKLETFKLIFDLYSPTMEEVNHMWGSLGGKQYPFVLYMMRMLDLKFKAIESESGMITEIVTTVSHKNGVAI